MSKQIGPTRPERTLQIKGSFQVVEEGRKKGTVKWFNPAQGYGFIVSEDGGDEVFAHQTNIQAEPGEYRTLLEGQDVEFTLVDRGRGPAAEKIEKLESFHSYWQG